MSKTRGRPKKPAGHQRDNVLRIRLTARERELLDEAASAGALETSTWARSVLIREAQKGRTTD